MYFLGKLVTDFQILLYCVLFAVCLEGLKYTVKENFWLQNYMVKWKVTNFLEAQPVGTTTGLSLKQGMGNPGIGESENRGIIELNKNSI